MSAEAAPQTRVRNLTQIFSPPSLPLVQKTTEQWRTTSILVRGGAGAGKTTLAVALAHAIAEEQHGAVLYLHTEFSPAELAYKARTLELGASILDWSQRDRARSGEILVQHLDLHRVEDEAPLDSAERKARAIAAAWELLHPPGESSGVAARVVVIDAFTLPEPADERTLRRDLLALIQGLEGEGVSMVVVEESAPTHPSWLPFVVDVVFELEWAPDPDSGELYRKLRCPKSRYAMALPGPHDYGLDRGVPAVWPDLLAVASTSGRSRLRSARSAAILLPLLGTNTYCSLGHGGVVSLDDGQTGRGVLGAIRATPGVVAADVRCAAMTVVHAAGADPLQVPDWQGAHSIGWALAQLVQTHEVNVVVLHDPELLSARRRFEVPLPHVVEALRLLGVLVVLHSTGPPKGETYAMADAWFPRSGQGSAPDARVPQRFAPARFRRVDAWIGLDLLDALGPRSTAETEDDGGLALRRRALGVVDSLLDGQPGAQSIESAVQPLLVQAAGFRASRLTIRIACRLYLLGRVADARRVLRAAAHGSLHESRAWAYAFQGDDAEAAQQTWHFLAGPTLGPAHRFLWWSMCAAYARSAAAMDELRAHLGHEQERLFICALLRARAASGADRVEVAGEEQRLATYDAPDWLLIRAIEEAFLESTRREDRQRARRALLALRDRADVPAVHRADASFNVGVSHEEEGQRIEAIEAYAHAVDLNAHLESARAALARLRGPAPASETR